MKMGPRGRAAAAAPGRLRGLRGGLSRAEGVPVRGLWAVVVVAAGCGGAPDCASLAGLERDTCLQGQIAALPASAAEEVLALAPSIEDPMVRGAAVSRWVGDHAAALSTEQGRALCALLEGRDGSYCLRRLNAPHLKAAAP